MLHSQLLTNNVQLVATQRLLILNSATDPLVQKAARQGDLAEIVLAEDNVVALQAARQTSGSRSLQHIPFHEYTLQRPPETMDVAAMNLLYQPGNVWMLYGLRVAAYALKPGARLYVVGAKDRGVLTMAKRMQEIFGNVETLAISKGQRVVSSQQRAAAPNAEREVPTLPIEDIFAGGKLDEGTRLLLEALEVRTTDSALDLGCGAGYIGLHVARLATKGSVVMVDASLAAVATARRLIGESNVPNVRVLSSDGTREIPEQRFDLVVTNPPFHIGGIQTTEVAERFIREAAQVLRPRGRFYLVANRFLKYEPALKACFKVVEEVGGDTRYRVLRMSQPG